MQLTTLFGFVQSIQSYINPAIIEYGFYKAESKDLNIAAATPTGGNTVETRLRINFNYIELGERKPFALHLGAPNLGGVCFNLVAGEGYRLKAWAGEDLAVRLNTLFGRTDVKYVDSALYSQRTKSALPSDTDVGGHVVLIDENDTRYAMTIPLVADFTLTQLETFVKSTATSGLTTGQALITYTDADIESIKVVTATSAEITDQTATAEAQWDSVEQKTITKCTYLKDALRKTVSLALPGVKKANLPIAGKRYYYLDKVIGDAIALAFTALHTSAYTFRFKNGRLKVKALQNV